MTFKLVVLISFILLVECQINLKNRRYRLHRRIRTPIPTYKIGTIFAHHQRNSPALQGFKYAISRRSYGVQFRLTSESVFVDDISNSFEVTIKICELLVKGVIAIFGPIHPEVVHTIQSLTDRHQILYFTFSDPHHYAGQRMESEKGKHGQNIIKLRPRIGTAMVDWLQRKGWRRILYLYDSREALFRLRMMFEHSNNRHISLSADARSISDYKNSAGVLNYINTNFQYLNRRRAKVGKHVILDLNRRVSKQAIFKQITSINTDRLDYHYLLIDINNREMNSKITNLTNGGVNFTTFTLLDYNFWMVKDYIKNNWNSDKRKESYKVWMDGEQPSDIFPYDVALMEDGISLLIRVLETTVPGAASQSMSTEPCTPKTNPPFTALNLLPKISKIQFEGLSGNVQFDDNGFRINYRVDIYEAQVKQSYTRMGNWTNGKLLLDRNIELKPGKPDYKNRTLIVTSIEQPPFLQVVKDANGNETYEGFCVDLMEAIKNLKNFRYKIEIVPDGYFGKKVGDTWNGMIGELVKGSADLAVAPLTITSERERAVDFSTPFMDFGLSVMFRTADKQPYSWLSFMEPLSTEIWMCIAFAYLGVSVVLFLVSRFNPYEWSVHPSESDSDAKISNEFSIFNSFWFSLSAFMQQGGDISPKSLSGRIVGGVWWFFTLIIVSSYTANLAAYLTVERMSNPIQSYEDLAKQTKIKYGVVASGSSEEFFKNSKMDVFKKMWQFMESNPSVFVDEIKKGYQRVKDSNHDYAFLLESTMNDYYNQRHPCKTTKVGPNLDSGKGYGIATPPGSDLRDEINLAVLELKEKNNITQLVRKWWDTKGDCGGGDKKEKNSGTNSLGLDSVRGLFYLLIGGIAIGIFLSIGEFFYKCSLEAKRKKRDFSEVFREMAYFSTRGKSLPNSQEDICALKPQFVQEKVEYSF